MVGCAFVPAFILGNRRLQVFHVALHRRLTQGLSTLKTGLDYKSRHFPCLTRLAARHFGYPFVLLPVCRHLFDLPSLLALVSTIYGGLFALRNR